jgi:hypothetical protein
MYIQHTTAFLDIEGKPYYCRLSWPLFYESLPGEPRLKTGSGPAAMWRDIDQQDNTSNKKLPTVRIITITFKCSPELN